MSVIRTAAVPRARRGTRALPRLTVALLAATLAVDVLFLIGLLVSGGQNDPLVNVGLSLATQWVPVTVFWVVAARTGFRSAPVLLAAAAVTFSALGDTYYSLAMDADGYLVFPSPADAGYLLFYPLMVLALVLLVRRQLRGVGGLVLLETAVATVGASAVLALVLDPVIGAAVSGDEVLDDVIAVAYPLFDLLLLAVIAGIASVPTVSIGRRWWAMVTGLGIFAVADVAYALLEGAGTYIAGTPLDATWAVGLGFITWWVVGAASPSDEAERPPHARRIVMPIPAIAVLAGLAALIIGTQLRLSILTVVLAALTVGLGAVPIIFRQAMLGRMLAFQEQALERLTELDQAKTDILVTMNHEFRTPLTSINGSVDLLLDGDLDGFEPAAVGMLRTIERNGARLQALIDDTLTASRLEESRGAFAREPLAVAALLAAVAARVEARADSRQIVVVVDAGAEELVVDADPTHLERALVNLVDNAVKFSRTGGLVTITAAPAKKGRDVVIRIADAGIGVPDDDVRHLGTRFFRASNVQNAAIPGVGLGLSITRQIVRAHGGALEIESTLGEGTTVSVRLPLAVRARSRPRRG